MRKTIWEKRIPTLLGIFIITISIVATSLLVKNGAIFVGRAIPSGEPKNLRITNITDLSFTVSYITDASVLGSISFGKDKNLGNNSLDDQDQKTNNINAHQVHYITVRNLEPSTGYFFAVNSGQTNYLNNDVLFEVTTAPAIESKPTQQKPISGKVVLPDGTIPKEAIVYVTADNDQAISTLVKSDGSYILPLNSLRDKDLVSYAPFSENTILKILIVGAELQSSIRLLAKQINPVPTVTLSKNYDFTIGRSDVWESTTASSSGSVESFFSSFSTKPASNKNPQIITPKKDDLFKDQQPLFQGIASPGANIKIIIQSESGLQAQVTADKNGIWTFRPSAPLPPGKHTISITTRDQFGILKTIAQSFTVFAAGNQVIESATPSATPKLILSVTPSSQPTPTATPAASPTPTLTPTLTPVPTLPATGNSSVITGGVVALATTIFGVLLFLLTRGSTPL